MEIPAEPEHFAEFLVDFVYVRIESISKQGYTASESLRNYKRQKSACFAKEVDGVITGRQEIFRAYRVRIGRAVQAS